MSIRIEPSPVLRVCSCLTAHPSLLPEVETRLIGEFGPLALRSPPFPFDQTEYYREEMGVGIDRTWICFRELCGPDALPEYRHVTGRIEAELADGGLRRVNLDPGYLDLGKLVLASLKEAPDKLYLGKGVWGHTCLRYRFGEFSAPDHSFPDFQDGRFNSFFTEARRLYKSLLQEQGT